MAVDQWFVMNIVISGRRAHDQAASKYFYVARILAIILKGNNWATTYGEE